MKPYNERLPLIDAAIEATDGDIERIKDYRKTDTYINYTVKLGYFSVDSQWAFCGDTVCTHEEFEQRARELGYKPKEQEMNNYWYEKGELPPVGSVVSFHRSEKHKASLFTEQWCEGDHLEVLAHKKGETEDVAVVWNQRLNKACGIVLGCLKPIRTERDALVEKAEMDIHQRYIDMISRHHIHALIDAGWRPVKQQTEDEFAAQAQELTDYVSTYQLSKLYRAGCRFLDQGE